MKLIKSNYIFQEKKFTFNKLIHNLRKYSLIKVINYLKENFIIF